MGWNARNSNTVRTRAVSAALYNMFVQSGNIVAVNIYRDDALIDWVPTEENTYTDSDIAFGQEYCYKVKAVYEEGESNPTDVECGAVTDPADFSVVDFADAFVEANQNVIVDVSMDNQFDVAGFQFDVDGATVSGASGGDAAA